MNADISETIKNKEFRFSFRSLVRSTSLASEYAKPTLTPAKPPKPMTAKKMLTEMCYTRQ